MAAVFCQCHNADRRVTIMAMRKAKLQIVLFETSGKDCIVCRRVRELINVAIGEKVFAINVFTLQ